MKKNNKKGFTLAELLIVVAIIAVLVAIAIPVFSTQLEKAKEGVDLANVRTAYAEVKAASLGTKDMTYFKEITGKQAKAGFKYVDVSELPENLGTTYKEALDKLTTTTPIYITCTSAGAVTITATAQTASSTLIDVATLD